MSFGDRLKHAWNAFSTQSREQDQVQLTASSFGFGGATSSAVRPGRVKTRAGVEKSIIPAIYNRMSVDVSSVPMMHVRLDQNGRFSEAVTSGLNECLTLEANVDQGAQAFMQDAAMTLFEEGSIAIVPVITDMDPTNSNAYDIKTMRVGKVVKWNAQTVVVDLYDDRTGKRKNIELPKTMVAIVENPFYTVMNEPNSNLKRLTRKISLLDAIDEQAGSGKLDLIIQLPYVIKSEAKRQQADQRRSDIEDQLKDSRYGIAYTDGTERVTQLNRPAENNMLKTIEYLTGLLYGQLGVTAEVLNGTADEKTMLNYNKRTIKPILTAIAQEMKRTFLSKTARTRGQSIEFYPDPFDLMPISDIAELGDKFIRNQIMTPNEIRGIMGMKPSDDPKADVLNNPNVPSANPTGDPSTAPADGQSPDQANPTPTGEDPSAVMQSAFDSVDQSLDEVFASLGVSDG